eukprot:gnl/TRDRNA2_/TRDRNA2_72826_c0_seq1.p1 gnl/TRDRNA2_/TRDRNA2_72826_c0~~gnl/TRDRNA2_/TRDRNA2_72826_c0_seq1.p1  ORF type:complete len:103 (-),score=4.09 gnl/TRDRNA2_/TRDRNA2_72826_c0_seq1:38-346(-)
MSSSSSPAVVAGAGHYGPPLSTQLPCCLSHSIGTSQQHTDLIIDGCPLQYIGINDSGPQFCDCCKRICVDPRILSSLLVTSNYPRQTVCELPAGMAWGSRLW